MAIAGTLEIKGVALPVQLTGSLGGPLVDPYGRERINLALETTVDRSAFGLDWNAELPSGEQALAQDVKITRRARAREGRLTMRILGISGSLARGLVQHGAPRRPRASSSPTGPSSSSGAA